MKKKGTGEKAFYRNYCPLNLTANLTFILLFFGIVLANASDKDQQKKFNLELENVSVAEVIQKIESMTDYIFIFSEDATCVY